ncbi:ABC transporter ATP-binding protein [Pelagibacterium montanilacus]|uniref:ABC transporter ATP-binding protein n=1 Tax=Pelagibacterium montanilacus TaxID=2185280 RepID=UPI000F8F6708|nr:ABC transporter ATP-binding protein [Pelagibacterium montanilacus]
MADTFAKLWALLTTRERRQAGLLLVVMLALGVIEMAGVASIFPLIAVLSNPEMIETNPYLNTAYEMLGFSSNNGFFVALSAGVFAVIVLRTVFTAINSYGMLRYAQMRSHSLSVKLLGSYLRRPYAFFLNRHSADMGKSVLSEVEQVVNGSLMPALQLVSKGIIAFALVSLVVVVEPVIASISVLVLAGAYGLVYFTIRGYLQRKGGERIEANKARFQIAQEVLGGVKEVKVGGLEHGYLRRFDKASLRFARLKTQLALVKEVPQQVLELIALGSILTLIMVLLIRADGQLSAALPTLALYAFAGLRLLPAIQQIYKSFVALRFGGPALDALHTDLFEADHALDIRQAATPLPLVRDIELKGVSFAYPNSERTALKDISLTIPVHSTVGFVGPTGAGKSTIVDVILGLLEPQSGALLVDGVPITRENVRRWQKSVGYVPQQIFLADESIAANIALGLPPEKIDMAAVERAARMANLHDFIVSDLPKGYGTDIGDRGVRLSGGQRQRIGIARALYHDPDVLVLDEATSALDNATEAAVMDAVYTLSSRKTIIMIAHRLTTVERCDRVMKIASGRIDRNLPNAMEMPHTTTAL